MTTNPRPQLRRGFHEPVDYGAVYTSNAEPHGVDLPPALNLMYCRNGCGPVDAKTWKCPQCDKEAAQ
jgi:hypothetical protein